MSLIFYYRVSSSNCARIYTLSLSNLSAHIVNNKLAHLNNIVHNYEPHIPWAVSLELQGEHALNGFFLYSLLLDKAERDEVLVLSNKEVSQRDRLKEALSERNKRTEGIGQENYAHACDSCFIAYKEDTGHSGEF